MPAIKRFWQAHKLLGEGKSLIEIGRPGCCRYPAARFGLRSPLVARATAPASGVAIRVQADVTSRNLPQGSDIRIVSSLMSAEGRPRCQAITPQCRKTS